MQTWQLASVGVCSLLVAILVVATQRFHAHWTGDFEDSGVQKHHSGSPPRVGIIPVLAGLLLALYFASETATPEAGQLFTLLLNVLLGSLPVLLLGLADDLTKKVPPRVRLAGACAAALLGIALVNVMVVKVDIPLLDAAVQWAPVAVLVTVLLVAGFTNAMNIVDGLNGLSSGLGIMMLLATAVAAAATGDALVLQLCVVLAVAVGGFMLANFPRGLIFLGDGAAYFLGFALVQVWMLLVARNPEITVWFVVALAAHPTMETVFSMYRRSFHRGRGGAFTAADRLHLHSLVYRRRTLRMLRRMPWMEPWVPNAAASVLVLLFGAMPMAAALLAPTSVLWCIAVCVVYVVAYLVWFKRLVGFGRLRPALPVAPRTQEAVAASSAAP
jgi:UDP-N-acetylmuramyl pentapeptide phosphotransferase/UDP-N-acetylglucosamine-1-phosphate transferase